MNSTASSSDQPPSSSASPFAPPQETPGATSIHDTVEKVRQATATTAGKVKDMAAAVAGDGKSAVADRVAGYGDRLREASRSAEAAKDPNIAHFAGQAADRLGKVADYVRDADFSRLREDATQVARRHPALFMGGMLVAGLVLGNLAKASFQSLGESGPEGVGDNNPPDDGGQDRAQGNGERFAFEGGEDDGVVAGADADNRNSES